jgi:6-pyruvoyltetrahydropterin/6-carboxytetrahydropterin synthase
MPTTLTRTVSFFARHRLYRPEWSLEQNREAFGALSAEPPHGHQYQCAVTVEGGPDAPSDLLVDLAELDRILHEEVVEPLNDKYLNRDIPAFARALPTCEAMAQHLFRRIAACLPKGTMLRRVRVAEDTSLYADCSGDP